ncbi:MAG: conserved rane protein of unknown function [Modestobacter sp.]|nr:conserved rane protein of unknown function [Modestobacter sp.]
MTAPDPVRAGKALNGAAAAILLLEGIAVLFVPRGIAQTGPGLTGARLTFLIALAVLLILASGLQRKPRGLLTGTVLQVPLLLTGLLGSAMWLVGGIFVLIWLYLLQIRKELLGSPFGPPPEAGPAVPPVRDDAGPDAPPAPAG